jgi:SET domain-containing protein
LFYENLNAKQKKDEDSIILSWYMLNELMDKENNTQTFSVSENDLKECWLLVNF